MIRQLLTTLIILIALLLGEFTIAAVRSCEKNSDCVASQTELCEICVDPPDPEQSTSICKLIQPDSYAPDSGCTNYTDQHCPLECDWGTCRTTDANFRYAPFCHCFFGTQPTPMGGCLNNPTLKPTIIAVGKEFNGPKYPCCMKSYLVFRILAIDYPTEEDLFKDLKIYYKIGNQAFRNYPTKKLVVEQEKNFFYSTKLAFKIAFPYSIDDTTYRFNQSYVGYNTVMFLELFSADSLIYRSSWTLFVSYEDLQCRPTTIQLSNCGKSPEHPVKFLRRSELQMDIIFRSEHMETFSDSCSLYPATMWMIWKIEGGRTSYAPQYDGHSNTRSITFSPYQLKFGSYVVGVTDAFLGPVISKGWYFSVICERLVAVIREGSYIMVGADGLFLRADTSYDPNKPSNDQKHVNIEWTCKSSKLQTPRALCDPKQFSVDETYFVSPDLLIPGGVYIFTLKVWTDLYDLTGECATRDVSPSFAQITVKVGKEPDPNDQYGEIVIECRLNCGPKMIPNRKLFLEVVETFNVFHNNEYNWTYHAIGEDPTSIDLIAENGVSPTLLVIKENTLKAGTTYIIGAEKKGSSWYAEYLFETYIIDFEGNCTISPDSGGIKGLTQFQIICTVKPILPYQSFQSYFYEYYDRSSDEKAEAEPIFSGRMLGTSNDGLLNNIQLTGGQVIIFVFNEYGIYLKLILSVKLSDWDINDSDLNVLYKNMTDQLRFDSSSRALERLSVIPDIIPPAMDGNKSDILNTLLGFITNIPLNTVHDVKLSVSTLWNILFTMNKHSVLSLSPVLMAATLKFVNKQAAILFQNVVNDQSKNIDPDYIKHSSKSILDIMEAVLSCKDTTYENIDEEDIEPASARRLRESSMNLERTLKIVTGTLGLIQVSGDIATSISSRNESLVIWITATRQIDLMPDLISRGIDIPIRFGEKLRDDLRNRKNKNEDLALHVVSSKENLFWWRKSNVRSRLVSVTINRQWDRTRTLPIRHVDKPMGIILKLDNIIKNVLIEGDVQQLDPTMDLVSLDSALKVYRVDIPNRSLVAIRFTLQQTTLSLKVYVDDKLRPDYLTMKEKAITITESSPVYHVPYYDYEEPYFLFIGVMPGPEVGVNQSISFTFQIVTSLCQTWVEGQWSSVGCHVKNADSDQLLCECTHFSIFAAAFPVAPNTVDPFSDAKLFLTVIENPLVVGLVIAILLIYLLLAILCFRSDRENKKKRHVIFLDDNFPTDGVPYLIAVYTSARWNAGSSSHVGIRLIGDLSSSRHHILLSRQRRVLQTNSDDWFLLFSPEPLGDLQCIHVWHDNYGPSPGWFCGKICVFDLQNQAQVVFIVDQWIALSTNQLAEAVVLPAVSDDFTDIRSLFFTNIVIGFREKHMFISCLSSHPRDEVSRLQRITVFLCGVMAAMLCNIMFYLPENEKEHIDEYYYSMGSREFYVSIQTVIICFLVNFIIILFFRRSYKYTYTKHYAKRSVDGMTSDKSINDSQKKSLVKSMRYNFAKLMLKTIETYPLTPVTLPYSESNVEVRRFWLILAWTSCVTTLVLCSYFTMLYGLRLGFISSQKWLSSILIGMGEEILLFTPVKIIFMSSLLAAAFKHMFDLNVHKIPIKEVVKSQIDDDPEHAFRIIERRTHTMYKPMSSKQRHETLRRKKVHEQWWTFSDFIASVILTILLYQIVFQHWTSHFQTNAHILKRITQYSQDIFSSVNFFSVGNIANLEDYFEYTLVLSLYNLRWYNGKELNANSDDVGIEYWIRDYTHRMFGLPKVRQFRVVPKHCKNIVLKGGKCIPPWVASQEDTDDYGERWKPVLWSDVSRASSPWKYTEESTDLLTSLYITQGLSGNVYHSGGYVQTLGPTRKLTELRLGELRQNSWLDVRTRAVITELTLTNLNQHLLSHITLVAEYTATGKVLLLATAVTVDTKLTPTAWHALFIVITCYYLHRCLYLINRDGAVFCFLFSNVCRIIIVLLGIESTFLFFAHYYRSSGLFESFESGELDQYFDFDSFVIFNLFLRLVLCLLLIVSILHVIALLRVGRHVLNHVYTLRLSLWSLVWVTVVLVVVFIALFYSAPLVFWPSPAKSILMMKNSLDNFETYNLQCVFVQMFVIVKTVLVTICFWCYIVTIMWHIRLAKAYRPRSEHYNYFTFVVNQIVKGNKK